MKTKFTQNLLLYLDMDPKNIFNKRFNKVKLLKNIYITPIIKSELLAQMSRPFERYMNHFHTNAKTTFLLPEDVEKYKKLLHKNKNIINNELERYVFPIKKYPRIPSIIIEKYSHLNQTPFKKMKDFMIIEEVISIKESKKNSNVFL